MRPHCPKCQCSAGPLVDTPRAFCRLDPDIAHSLLRRSGFTIEAESDLFANAEDDHTLMVYSDEIYLQTDRFLFRAISPD